MEITARLVRAVIFVRSANQCVSAGGSEVLARARTPMKPRKRSFPQACLAASLVAFIKSLVFLTSSPVSGKLIIDVVLLIIKL